MPSRPATAPAPPREVVSAQAYMASREARTAQRARTHKSHETAALDRAERRAEQAEAALREVLARHEHLAFWHSLDRVVSSPYSTGVRPSHERPLLERSTESSTAPRPAARRPHSASARASTSKRPSSAASRSSATSARPSSAASTRGAPRRTTASPAASPAWVQAHAMSRLSVALQEVDAHHPPHELTRIGLASALERAPSWRQDTESRSGGAASFGLSPDNVTGQRAARAWCSAPLLPAEQSRTSLGATRDDSVRWRLELKEAQLHARVRRAPGHASRPARGEVGYVPPRVLTSD